MPDSRMDWGELVSEIATLGATEADDEADDESEAEDDESEAVRFNPSRPWFMAPNVTRATRAADYGRNVRGQGQGVVQTPSGPARIELPGRFPTVEEFKKSVEAIQKDVQKNSDGIKQLSDVQRRDSLRLAQLVAKSERRLRKQMTRTQIIAIAAAAVLPFVGRLIDQKLNP
jgi:hypothetical protein